MSEQKAGTSFTICSNCGKASKAGVRFCSSCGCRQEPLPARRMEPFGSGRTLVVNALQQKRVEEACNFLDRQVQAGARILDQQLENSLRRLSEFALSLRAQPIPRDGEKQHPSGSDRLRAGIASALHPAKQPETTEAPVFCLRCGTENRQQGRYCGRCGAPLSGTTAETDLSVSVSSASDPGRVREVNEDRVQVWHASIDGHMAWLAALADGMGGEQAGEVASSVALEAVGDQWRTTVSRQALADREKGAIVEMVQEANRRVHAASRTGAGQQGMGTTLTLLLCWKGSAHLANVGDSRAYLFDNNGRVNQVTRDHSLVAVLTEIGQITVEEAADHEQRNLLYRCVGRESTVEVDTFARRLEPGDHFLLCSDGLTLHLTDHEILQIVKGGEAPPQVCQKLITAANVRGGQDNVSVVVVQVDEPQRHPGESGRADG